MKEKSQMSDIIKEYLDMMQPVFYGPYTERIAGVDIEVTENEVSASRYLDFVFLGGRHTPIKVAYTVERGPGLPPMSYYPAVMEGLEKRVREEIEAKSVVGYELNWK